MNIALQWDEFEQTSTAFLPILGSCEGIKATGILRQIAIHDIS
jgi:hypothetical protein